MRMEHEWVRDSTLGTVQVMLEGTGAGTQFFCSRSRFEKESAKAGLHRSCSS